MGLLGGAVCDECRGSLCRDGCRARRERHHVRHESRLLVLRLEGGAGDRMRVLARRFRTQVESLAPEPAQVLGMLP